MAGRESLAKVIGRDRPPRVQLQYKVQIGDAIENRELPFVVGIMADLSGNKPTVEKKKLKERRFVDIDTDNFDEVMKKQGVGLEIKVDDANDPESKFKVNLTFSTMDDFHPDRIVQQVEPLRALLETRRRLEALLDKADDDDDLRAKLEEIVNATESGGTARESSED